MVKQLDHRSPNVEGSDILTHVSSYYTEKLRVHGTTPQGVDWNGADGQRIRFEQLAKIITTDRFSISDLGCGYGSFYEFLEPRYAEFSYLGYDVADAMVKAAQTRIRQSASVSISLGAIPQQETDYAVASGIFNVRLNQECDIWRQYVNDTLESLNRTTRLGFAFNCLTTYSDADRIRRDLFYANPCEMFDHCKSRYSRHVALLHDYGLYEFTVLVRKNV